MPPLYDIELDTSSINLFVLDRFFDREITDIVLEHCLSALKLGIQHVAITQKACGSIKIKSERKLTIGEKKSLILKSEENMNLGITLENDICHTYRHEGKV